MEEKKVLEPGKTVLGSIPASYDGKIAKMTVRFGNYIFPPIKKGEKEEFVHLKVAEYRKLLEQFLNSPAGQQYKRPSEEEIEQASILVLNKENEYLKAHGFDAPKKEEKKTAEESKEKPAAKAKKAEPKAAEKAPAKKQSAEAPETFHQRRRATITANGKIALYSLLRNAIAPP